MGTPVFESLVLDSAACHWQPISMIARLILALAAPLAMAVQDVPARSGEEPTVGTVCLWAIYNTLDQVGKRCHPGEDAALQAFVAEGAGRLDRVLIARGGMTQAQLDKFRRQQTGADLPDAEFCKAEGPGGFYGPARSQDLDGMRRDLEKVLARPGKPVWGDCL